jgi:hypothetical protein
MKRNNIDRAAAAIDRYQLFHRHDPKRIIEVGAKFKIPDRLYCCGNSKWVTYRSSKVDPDTLRKPSRPVDYIHEHDSRVRTYLGPSTSTQQSDTDVPQEFRDVEALTRLGFCLGFCFEDMDGGKVEARSTQPYPDLYTTPDGRCLLVIQSRRTVIAMMWGGALGVFARGIDG